MNEYQTINDIVGNTVKHSSYITVIISSCVFICYTVIMQLIGYFKQKNRNKPLIEMADAVKENTENIIKLNVVLDKIFKDAATKESHKCKNAIESGFEAFASRIGHQIETIIIHNNIEANKQLIIDNITKLVSIEYYKLYAILSDYEINNQNVAKKLKEDWMQTVRKDLISIVYNGQDTVTRITQLNNRLNIYKNNYSTFINNKIFNT